jgi:MATE family multidrug resistance protein
MIYFAEYKNIIKLGLPITIAQVGLTLQGMADTLMLGQYNASDLAAAGFANSLLIMAQLLGMGFSMSSVPVIGKLYSQRRYAKIVSELKASLFADIMQGVLVCLLMYMCYALLPFIGVQSELLPQIKHYIFILIPSLLVMNFCYGMKNFYDCLTDTRITMWIVLTGNIWNIIWNWVLIFGRLGFPEMGIVGAAWATLTSRILMAMLYILFFVNNKKYALYRRLWADSLISKSSLMNLNKLGWPIAFQLSIELAAFSGIALTLGRGGDSWDATSALVAHQVGCQIASFVYMFYIGIGSAVAIRVSHYFGLQGWNGIQKSAHAGYHLIFLIGLLATLLVFVFRNSITAFFVSNDNPQLFTRISSTVVSMIVPLIFYQVGDGMQTCYVNALRGMGDVKKLLKYSIICYALITIPCSYLFGITLDFGAVGIWWGFPIGLTIAGILYFRRFLYIVKEKSVDL